MTSQANDAEVVFIDGLLWYLETLNWAFDKIRSLPTGSQRLDVNLYHYLYFSNLFGAVDLVRDYIKAPGEKVDWEDAIKQCFDNADDYSYARELRNAIVHRGFNPAAASHVQDAILRVLCPPIVKDRTGKKSYYCNFTYTVDLAECCNQAVSTAIYAYIDCHGFLEPGKTRVTKEATLEAINASAAMPNYVKTMAAHALASIDFTQMATTIEATNIAYLKKLLGRT